MSDAGYALVNLLLGKGLLTEQQVIEAMAESRESGQPVGRILIEHNWVGEEQLLAELAWQVGLQFIDLDATPPDPSLVALVPEALLRQHCCIPVRFEDNRLVVAMSDPMNVVAKDDLRVVTGFAIEPAAATRAEVEKALERLMAAAPGDLGELVDNLAGDTASAEEDLEGVRAQLDDAPIVKLVNQLISNAVIERASDIHIEPLEREVRIRYRIDGVLHERSKTPKSVHASIVSRIKVMSDMNIAERRLPQDGRLSVRISQRPIDLRVATLPTVFGEKVVMRVLDKGSILLSLRDLGFAEGVLATYEASYKKPYGAILVTGPTGSGKSTTLYATLHVVSRPEINVITVEDPVEYRIAGINQIQTNVKAGLTFASALRSILRADPDVVLIGEIRDHETGKIAVEAALTGHLVLSTLHTNDAASTPGRLIEMGVEPFLVASALDCVLAQRLCRRLCQKCRQPADVPSELFEKESLFPAGGPTVYRAVGCSECARTGYRGRVALVELMLMSEKIKRLAVERRSSNDIREVAMEEGMVPLRDDGLRKVAAGETSVEEILRVTA